MHAVDEDEDELVAMPLAVGTTREKAGVHASKAVKTPVPTTWFFTAEANLWRASSASGDTPDQESFVPGGSSAFRGGRPPGERKGVPSTPLMAYHGVRALDCLNQAVEFAHTAPLVEHQGRAEVTEHCHGLLPNAGGITFSDHQRLFRFS